MGFPTVRAFHTDSPPPFFRSLSMISSFLKLFAGSHHRRFLRECAPLVRKINELEKKYQKIGRASCRERV